jgi:DNA-directed RNA polymerase subunit beta'
MAGPVASPTKDMVLGCYYLTMERPGALGEGKIFKDTNEAILAYQSKAVHLQAMIKVRKDGRLIETTVGRLLFNTVIPEEVGFVNELVPKKTLEKS